VVSDRGYKLSREPDTPVSDFALALECLARRQARHALADAGQGLAHRDAVDVVRVGALLGFCLDLLELLGFTSAGLDLGLWERPGPAFVAARADPGQLDGHALRSNPPPDARRGSSSPVLSQRIILTPIASSRRESANRR
jgi:hypothetical protein